MSARRQIIAALSEDSLGGIATLADVAHAEQLADAHRTEVLAADGQAYDGELAMLRGLVDTLRVVVRHDSDLAEVWRLLVEYTRDDAAARNEATAEAATATPDTLAEWLYVRFVGHERWNSLAEDDRAYWEHEARAVRRAVQRGGFLTATPVAGDGRG